MCICMHSPHWVPILRTRSEEIPQITGRPSITLASEVTSEVVLVMINDNAEPDDIYVNVADLDVDLSNTEWKFPIL